MSSITEYLVKGRVIVEKYQFIEQKHITIKNAFVKSSLKEKV